jgi:hypothetical protein
MVTFLRAYVCASPAAALHKGPYHVGVGVEASKGVLVARELDDALIEHHAWPVTLHEVETVQMHVVDEDEQHLKVRKFRVVRDLPLSDAFGPHANEIIELFAQLRRWPWLAPRAALDAERVAGLIRSHYAALGAYASVDALPCRIVTTWDDAMVADNDALVRKGRPPPSDPAMGAALDALQESPLFEPWGHAIRKALVVPYHLAFQAMWEAAWDAGAAALLTTAARTGTTDTRTRVKAINRIRGKLDASRDRCRRAAWQAVLAQHEAAAHPERAANRATLESLAARSDDELVAVWTTAWNFATAAATAVGRAARHMVALPDAPNPWLPLVELYRMGAWPIDEVAGAYVLFCRAPTS